MPDLKFSCPQCGQHIACGEEWAGHSLECPACHINMVVPQAQASAPQPVPTAESPRPGAPGARLAPGVTQARNPKASAPGPSRKITSRPPAGDNSLLKYGLLLLVLAIVGGAVYFYVVPLITNAFEPGSSATAGSASQGGASRGGPLGEVNDAMDVSETLDGGSSPKKPQPPTTNNPARPRPTPPRR